MMICCCGVREFEIEILGDWSGFFPHVDHILECIAAHDTRHLGRRRRRALSPPPGLTVAPFGCPHLAVAHQRAVQAALWGAAGSPAYSKKERPVVGDLAFSAWRLGPRIQATGSWRFRV